MNLSLWIFTGVCGLYTLFMVIPSLFTLGGDFSGWPGGLGDLGRGEPLADRLLGHADPLADPRPRVAAVACPVDEVADEMIGTLLEVGRPGDRLLELCQWIIRFCGADGVDEVLQLDG